MKVKRVVTPEGKRFKIALEDLEDKQGKVGWFEKSRYDDKKNTPVAFVAAQNEYGNPEINIPARPFMRPTILQRRKEWKNIADRGAKQIIKGQETIYGVLDLIGQQAIGDIKRTISRLWHPPLSPVTIALRLERKSDRKTIGNLDKPLIDTGVMYETIINIVEDV